jgi:hypothetical protein
MLKQTPYMVAGGGVLMALIFLISGFGKITAPTMTNGLHQRRASAVPDGCSHHLHDYRDSVAAYSSSKDSRLLQVLVFGAGSFSIDNRKAGSRPRMFAELRGQRLPLQISPMPFVPNTYKR